jgi:hypothetical protein
MIPLRPPRIVRVTNEQELDAALASADQLIVEGDDRLLSYAVAKASGDPESRVSIELQASPKPAGLSQLPEDVVRLGETPPRGPIATSAPSPAAWGADRRIVLAVMLLIAVLFGLGGWLVLVETTGPPATVTASSDVMGRIAEPQPGIHVPSRPQPQEQPEQRAGAPSNAASIAQALAWPAVAIIAIIALFLVARQAIAGGRNVEITWKVTEKVTGRVVITRVTNRARSSNPRVAA